MTPTCAGLPELRVSELKLLKSTSNAENFVRRLFWFIASHVGAIYFIEMRVKTSKHF